MRQMMKTAIYCRVASEDDICIGMQKAEVLQYAKEQGYENITVYEDNGVSGSSFDRPAFSKMQADIDNKKIDMVLIKSISRLGRNTLEVCNWLESMESKGIEVIAIDGSCEMAPGSFLKQAVAELYRKDIRFKRKKNGKALAYGGGQ